MEDEVIEEIPVFLNMALAPYLHLVAGSPPAPAYGDYKILVKREHGWFWLDVPIDIRSAHYDPIRAKILLPSLTSSNEQASQVPPIHDPKTARGYVGRAHPRQDLFLLVRTADQMHLTPIKASVELSPSLAFLDRTRHENAINKRSDDANHPLSSGQAPLTITIQKRETEEQLAARLSSYAHVHKKWAEERWQVGTYYGTETTEARSIANQLIGDAPNAMAEFKEGNAIVKEFIRAHVVDQSMKEDSTPASQ